MFYLLLGLNLIYVIAEFSYNAFLLTNLSSPYPDVDKLEILGRMLSSFGATFIFYKIINSINLKLRYKLLSMFFCTLIIYPTVYIGQKELVDYLANNTTFEQRQKYQDLYIIRKGWNNGALQVDSLPLYTDTVENNVIYNVFGFLNSSNNELLNEYNENKDVILENVLKQDMIYNIDNSYKFYKKLERELYNSYNDYRRIVKNNYIDELSRSRVAAERQYQDIKNREGTIYRKQYYEVRSEYNRARRLVQEYIEVTFGETHLFSISHSLSQRDFENAKDNYKREQERLINIFVEHGISRNNFSVYSYEDFCSIQGGNGVNYRAVRNINGVAVNRDSIPWSNSLASLNRYVCRVGDLSNEYSRLMTLVDRKFNEKFGLLSYNYNSQEELFADPNFVRWVANISGLNIDTNIRYNTKENFINDYVAVYESIVRNKVQQEIRDLYLLNTDISLEIGSINEFINNKVVIEILKKEGFIGIDNFKIGLSKEEFISEYAYDFLPIQVDYLKNINLDNYEAVDLVKLMLIPSFALFLSVFFGLINLVILIKSVIGMVFNKVKEKNMINIFYLVSIALIIIIPMFINLPFVDDSAYLFIEESLNNNVKLYLTKWLINIEALLFYAINGFK